MFGTNSKKDSHKVIIFVFLNSNVKFLVQSKIHVQFYNILLL